MSSNRHRQKSQPPNRLTLAAAIVIHSDCVLIVRRSKNEKFLPSVWGIPCGKIDWRERERAKYAVIRELQEETGLKGKVLKQVGDQTFRSNWRGRETLNVQYNYLVSLEEDFRPDRVSWRRLWGKKTMPRVKTPKRDQIYRWVPLDELGQETLDPHNREAIRQALEVYTWDRPASSDIMESSMAR